MSKSQLSVDLPDDIDVTVIRKPPMPIVASSEVAVRDALANPVKSPPLAELAANSKTACIVICDITRPVPNHLFLRPTVEMLVSGGVPLSGIRILVATGLHRPNEGEELAELIGDRWVLENVVIENHFARDDDSHVTLGTTSTRGTVVRLNKHFVNADIKIATGLVEPHFMAGYSGGRKVIAPGIAHAETITTFHSARFMADPAAANCNFIDNPLHEEQLEIVEMLGGALALNTVIDEDRNLSFVNFGDIISSHAAAVEFARPYCEVPIERQFSTVVSCAAGYPLDKTYYQTIKGMVGAMGILKPGGDLIIASECSEGMGSSEFVDSQRRLIDLGPDGFLNSILTKTHANVDEWQTQMQLKPMDIGAIHLYSPGLSPADQRLTGVNVTRDISKTIGDSVRRSGDRSIAAIPEGPYIVPQCNN
ncbi:nickel-dependent lactate racemase [Planctomycetota bacterium]